MPKPTLSAIGFATLSPFSAHLSMTSSTFTWTPDAGWSTPLPQRDARAQLVLIFGPVETPSPQWFEDLAQRYPTARRVYVSGGGQMMSAGETDQLLDHGVTMVALSFLNVSVRAHQVRDVHRHNSADAAAALVAPFADLPTGSHVLVFCEGIDVRGDQFIEAIEQHLPAGVTVSGGLASNGLALSDSRVGLDAIPERNTAVAIALSGPHLRVATSVALGFMPFGPIRRVTHTEEHTLWQLDNEPALDVYRRYLGPFSEELPGSALLFPLWVSASDGSGGVTRTILGIEQDGGAMHFAGAIPDQSHVRLMRTHEDHLVLDVEHALETALEGMDNVPVQFGLVVSCIGRRAVLRSRSEEEAGARRTVSGVPSVVGFYSNGEFAPPTSWPGATGDVGDDRRSAQRRAAGSRAVLHNQTLVITLFGERA
jgi:hypothetical protein